MSDTSERILQGANSYSPPSSPSEAILHIHPPSVHSNSTESMENRPCSTNREPPHQFYNPTQQIDPENLDSIHSSMFPHDTTDEQNLTEEPISGIPSLGQRATPQLTRRPSAEMSSRLRPQDALFEPPDLDTDPEDDLIAPSEIDICSASSIHSSDQELALQRINMGDWSP